MDLGGAVEGQGEHDLGDGSVNELADISLDKAGGDGDQDNGGELAILRDVIGEGYVSQGGKLDISSSDKDGETDD